MAKQKDPNICHLYAFGDIYNAQGSDSAEWGIISLSGIMQAFKQGGGADADEVLLHIHTNGGNLYEALAIYDYLKGTGKTINTIVEGVCASAGTVLFLAGEKRTLSPNSRFLVHNPWVFAEGDADSLNETAERLRQEQERIVEFYVKHTGNDAETLQKLMDENRVITADEALELGFATEILDEVHAMALMLNKDRLNKFLPNKPEVSNMAKQEKTIADFLAGIQNLAKDVLGIKADATETPAGDAGDAGDDAGAGDAGDTGADDDDADDTGDADADAGANGEPTELEQARARVAELEAQLQARDAEVVEMRSTLETAEQALTHARSTFTPQARANSFTKADGKDGKGAEKSFEEKLAERRAKLKG